MVPVPDVRDTKARRTKWKREDEMEGDPQVQSGFTLPCQDKYGKVRIFDKFYEYRLFMIVFKLSRSPVFVALICVSV